MHYIKCISLLEKINTASGKQCVDIELAYHNPQKMRDLHSHEIYTHCQYPTVMLILMFSVIL